MSENGIDSSASKNDILTPQMNIPPVNGEQATQAKQKQANLSPADLQIIVMQSINNVNAKKDDLTIAVKQLSDLTTQLSKICAQQNEKLKELSNDN
jgi:hypothetical protein